MRPLTYPAALALIVFGLLAVTAAVALSVARLAGHAGLAVYFLVPALAMLARAIRCREPHTFLWLLFGALWAPYVWIALPFALFTLLRRP